MVILKTKAKKKRFVFDCSVNRRYGQLGCIITFTGLGNVRIYRGLETQPPGW
jgi:hypothetical protein